ncbi:hypothetical protein [Bacillus sp. J37]|uniref:hypothetical protein n=1 Tax=Bacillus sp. J37 TaxID=935837 RepID=UPI00047A7938|nr:hypothetical protein [Bacillus sp. J37]
MIKYNIYNGGIVEFIHNEMSVEEIVETILKQDYIEELFEGDMEAAEEEIFIVASDTKESFEYIDNFFRTLHRKSLGLG